ncbi:hypothetical protein [Rubrobacter calidifluminis]|uniref:hypothetical protein n=1 Tax=Rubrobacter calidifluminis TaxID=1392640 RepID=UPI0023623108|nr:hypothetical protein [Rubrobacter calidifluminis]
MDRSLIERALKEAREAGHDLVVWDRRDTFTIENDKLDDLSLEDGYLRALVGREKAVVYVELDSIYKLVVEKERPHRAGLRAGFGAG